MQQFLVHSIGDMLLVKKITSIFLFYGATPMGTATWFLTSLFEVLFFNSLVELVTSRVEGKFRRIVLIALFVCMVALCQYITSKDITGVNYSIKCFPACYVSFVLGRVVKEIRWKHLYSWWSGILTFIILIVFSLCFHIEVSAGKIDNVLIFLIASLCGWIQLRTFSGLILKAGLVSRLLQYIGRHTMPVLCLHVLSFKAISLLYIFLWEKPIVYLAAWHVIFDCNEAWKLLYTVAGIAIPIILYKLYGGIKDRVIICKNWREIVR